MLSSNRRASLGASTGVLPRRWLCAGRRTDAAREWREVLAMEPENKFAKLYLRLVAGPDARRSKLA